MKPGVILDELHPLNEEVVEVGDQRLRLHRARRPSGALEGTRHKTPGHVITPRFRYCMLKTRGVNRERGLARSPANHSS
jgi:hypothetical protein